MENSSTNDDIKRFSEEEIRNAFNNYDAQLDADVIDQMIDQVLEGVVQNISIEMDKQGITVRGLGELADVNYSHLSRMFNRQTRIGLTTIIKIAYALHLSPCDLFPFDVNKRKTNGQRFDEMTKDMDVRTSNYLLTMCADYTKEWRRIRKV